MNTWNWLLHFLIIFDLVAFGIYFGGDILFTAISKVQKKSKKDDDLDLYDFEIETAKTLFMCGLNPNALFW